MAEHPQLIRVSCAALCRIEHQGLFFLVVNRNRIGKGLGSLSPVGGALAVYDPSALAPFNVSYEKEANELRLFIEPKHWPGFREWFYARQGRETSPFRELYEELVQETGILPDLLETQMSCTYLRTVEKQSMTNRTNSTGLLTYYLWEIFDIQFLVPDILRRLLVLGRTNADQGGVWITQTQVIEGEPIVLKYHNEEHSFNIAADMLLAPTDSLLV